MITNADVDRLNELCDKYELVMRSIKVSDFNVPINRQEEKSKLFDAFQRQQEYNPQFKYREPPTGWTQPLILLLREIDPSQNVWENYLYQDIRRVTLESEAVNSHDPAKITSETIYAHGIPTSELVKQAYSILESTRPENENRDLSANYAADKLQTALKNIGLNDWSVVLEQSMNARMMVRSVEKKIFVREDALFSGDSIKRLLVHEIGTHIFRYINGEQQKLNILKLGLVGYLATEEGLATYHEKLFQVQDVTALRTYALRAIAANLSLSMGYFGILNQLSKFSSDFNQLFDIVTRAKRGFTDTRLLGGHVKDQVYLKGYLEVSRHLEDFPQNYDLLMCGKVSTDMVNELQQLRKSQILTLAKFSPNDLVNGMV